MKKLIAILAAIPALCVGQTKWSALTQETTATDSDWLMMLDATGPSNKKLTVSGAKTVFWASPTITGTLAVDTITDSTGAAGVSIESVTMLAGDITTAGDLTVADLNAGELIFAEAASVTDPTDGFSKFWVKNDAPTTPQFTDDANTTFQLATLTGTETLTNKTLDASANTVSNIGADELESTAVTPGSYTSADITVDADGRITAAANGTGGGGGSGYAIQFGGSDSAHVPADSTTYYVGAPWANASTVLTNVAIVVPKSGTITAFRVVARVAGALGTTEDVTFSMRLNDTTDFGSVTATMDAERVSVGSTPSQAVTAGDTIAVKMVAPAWVTNPTNVYYLFSAIVE